MEQDSFGLKHYLDAEQSQFSHIIEKVRKMTESYHTTQTILSKQLYEQWADGEQHESLKTYAGMIRGFENIISGSESEYKLEISNRDQFMPLSKAIFEPMLDALLMERMAIVYFYANLESFFKSYQYLVLTNRKQYLKSKKSYSCIEIAKHSSIESLVAFLAKHDVAEIGSGGTGTEKYFRSRCSIDIKGMQGWSNIADGYIERNRIVHSIEEATIKSKAKNNPVNIETIASSMNTFSEEFHKRFLDKLKLNDD